MKIVKLFIASVCFTVLASACVKNLAEEPDAQPQNETRNLTTITCEFPTMTDQNGTKVSLTEAGVTGWQAGDKIVIYGNRRHSDVDDHPELDKVIHTLTAAEVANPAKAVFTVDLSGLEVDPAGIHPYNAMYPADETDDYLPFYSPWGASGRTRFKDTNKMLMAGYLDGGVMSLQNLCAAITFKVSGDFDTYYFSGYAGTETVGYGQYLVELNNTENPGGVYNKKPGEEWGTKNPLTTISGPVNSNGTALNYIFIPIEADLTNGFTIVFAKSGVKLKTISTQTALSLDRAEMVNLGLLPEGNLKDYELIPASEKASATDLSADIAPYKSANCYIVSAVGTTNDNKVFKFPTVKGNSFVKGSSAGTSVGAVVSAEVLWETWNSSSTPTAKSVIKDVEYKDGFVYFKTPETLHEGNALIAAKDSEGNILWSWHIWVPATSIDDIDSGFAASDKKIMDRNLGALYVASTASSPATNMYGLYYQWGRKDPFYSSSMKGVGTSLTSSTTAVAYATSIGAPTVFYYTTEDDWSTDHITTLWNDGGSKSQYDPCPPGYKVPVYNSSLDLWNKTDTKWTFDTTTKYTKHEDHDSVLPMPGYLNSSSLGVSGGGVRALIWAGDANSTSKGYAAFFHHGESTKYNRDNYYKRLGGSVRCVAE